MMSESCDHNCEACQENCKENNGKPISFLEDPNALSKINKVIGIVSGKGGVGKSLVTSLLAVTMSRLGYRTAILDADITGPSIPKMFGLHEKATGCGLGIFPVKTKTGIEIMSFNLIAEHETDPVIWRGPMIAGAVKQFWTDVIWHDIDYMFIDMPPGTGDVPLTVFQSIAVNGIIVVTSPQELVSMIVSKAVRMAEMMRVPMVGLVENMSYFKCPDNGKEYKLFGESHVDEIAASYNFRTLAKLPVDPTLAEACDRGEIESFANDWLLSTAKILEDL